MQDNTTYHVEYEGPNGLKGHLIEMTYDAVLGAIAGIAAPLAQPRTPK